MSDKELKHGSHQGGTAAGAAEGPREELQEELRLELHKELDFLIEYCPRASEPGWLFRFVTAFMNVWPFAASWFAGTCSSTHGGNYGS
jgi:hypothetical protein